MHGRPARLPRGGAERRRRLRRRARAGAARRASRASGSSSTATRSPRTSCEAATEAGARIVVDNFDELDKLERARAPRRGDDPRHAGRRRRHARRDPHRPRGLEVRLLLAQAPSAIERLHARALGGPQGPAHAHRVAALRPRAVAARGRGDRDARRLRRLRPRRRPRRRLHARPPAADRSPSTCARCARTADELLGPGKQLSIEPGRALVATAGVTLYTRRVGQGRRPARRPRPFRRRRRGHVGQHAPDALRRAVRRRPRRPRRRGRARRARSSASTASPATS